MKNVGLLPSGEVDGEKNEIIVYQPEGGEFHIEVRVDQDTVWLTQAQMAELFNTDRTSINRHIRNIFQTQELYENSTCAKIAQVRLEGGRSIKRVVPYYNLDMIISVGYRVNSISGTRFRQWNCGRCAKSTTGSLSLTRLFTTSEPRSRIWAINSLRFQCLAF